MKKSDKKQILADKKAECLQEIKNIIELIGPWSINKQELAKKHKLGWHTVERIEKNLFDTMTPESLDQVSKRMEASLKKIAKHCERTIADPTARLPEKNQAAQIFNSTIASYTKFLEDWGRKIKVAERVEIAVDNEEELMREAAKKSKSDAEFLLKLLKK